MPVEANDSSAREQRVDEVIAAYLEAVDAGQTPDPNDFIAKHRDIADDLEAFFVNRDQFERLAGPLQAAASVPNQQSDSVDVTSRSSFESSQSSITTADVSTGTKVRCFGDYELLEEIARGGAPGAPAAARQRSHSTPWMQLREINR